MLNLYIACCQKLYTQHCHFLYIVNLLVTPLPSTNGSRQNKPARDFNPIDNEHA